MPKIEAGGSANSFLIDGIPYATGQYQFGYNTRDLAATECNITVTSTLKIGPSIAQGALTTWTDDGDASFASLQAFITYIDTIVFSSAGEGGGLTSSANGLSDDGTTVELGGSEITKNTTLSRDYQGGLGAYDVVQNLRWNNEKLEFSAVSNVTGNAFGFLLPDPEDDDLFIGYIEGGARNGFDIGQSGLIVKDAIDTTGPIGEADYQTNAIANDLAYAQVSAVKTLIASLAATTISAESAAITIALNGSTSYTESFTLTGAVVGDKVNWGLNDDFDTDLESTGNEIYGTARVTAADTVRVYWRVFTFMAANSDRKVWAQIVK